jgi:hypothetical protein
MHTLEKTNHPEGQRDSSYPTDCDLRQIKDPNIIHLAKALNNPRNYKRQLNGLWIAQIPNHAGELISWTYQHNKKKFWNHTISETQRLIFDLSTGKLKSRERPNKGEKWTKANLDLESYLPPPEEKDLPAPPLVSEITQMVRKLGPEDICVGNADEVGEWTTPVAFKLDGGKIQLAENLEQLTEYLNSQGYVKIAGQEITELVQTTQLLSDNRLVELEKTDSQ